MPAKPYIPFLVLFCLPTLLLSQPSKLLIPMDEAQSDHLKAYGVAFQVLSEGVEVDWLLNYRGGSFLFDYSASSAGVCGERGVLVETLSGAGSAEVYSDVQRSDANMDVVRLETVPRIAIYAPPNFQPWDDAVTMAMEYAEIPYEKVWDEEVLRGDLAKVDWLHLHHEDFTGQHGKFYASYRFEAWYQEGVALLEGTAAALGYVKVSQLKLEVALKIREFVSRGGFLFAMCSATDTYDIALASQGTDICASVYDGDPADPRMQEKLDYSSTLAFQDFPGRGGSFSLRVLRDRRGAERLWFRDHGSVHPLRLLGTARSGPDDVDTVPCACCRRISWTDNSVP